MYSNVHVADKGAVKSIIKNKRIIAQFSSPINTTPIGFSKLKNEVERHFQEIKPFETHSRKNRQH